MKWLTLTEIGRRARSKKGALEVSYEHWNQLYNATAKELRAEIDKVGQELYYTAYCGLCRYRESNSDDKDCWDCVLVNSCTTGESLWYFAKKPL